MSLTTDVKHVLLLLGLQQVAATVSTTERFASIISDAVMSYRSNQLKCVHVTYITVLATFGRFVRDVDDEKFSTECIGYFGDNMLYK